MPTLAETWTTSPSITKPCSQVCWIFQATVAAAVRSVEPSGRIAELVAAEARDGVGVAQGDDEPVGDLSQQLVAAVVPERVVDLLEAVEVHHQHGARVAVALGRRQRPLHVLAEQRAVREAGQPVVQRLVLERLGVRLALGDVAHGDQREAAVAVVRLAVLQLHREGRAVAAQPERLRQAAVRAARRGRVRLGQPQAAQLVAALRGDHERERVSDGLVLLIAEQPADRVVDRLDRAALVDDEEAVGDVVEHRLRAQLAVARRRSAS